MRKVNDRGYIDGEGCFGFLIVLGVLGLIALIVMSVLSYTGSTTYEDCVVVEKDRTEEDMRVYTENCGVLVVSDNWFKGVTNAADLYGRIESGETYTFETAGFRFPLLSIFPRIYDIKEDDNA